MQPSGRVFPGSRPPFVFDDLEKDDDKPRRVPRDLLILGRLKISLSYARIPLLLFISLFFLFLIIYRAVHGTGPGLDNVPISLEPTSEYVKHSNRYLPRQYLTVAVVPTRGAPS